jgi:hypothetical protein
MKKYNIKTGRKQARTGRNLSCAFPAVCHLNRLALTTSLFNTKLNINDIEDFFLQFNTKVHLLRSGRCSQLHYMISKRDPDFKFNE